MEFFNNVSSPLLQLIENQNFLLLPLEEGGMRAWERVTRGYSPSSRKAKEGGEV